MAIQHISELSAADFEAVIGQTFQIPTFDGVRKWKLLDVETHIVTLGGEPRCCGEGEKVPAKKKMDAKATDKAAKAAVAAINAELDEIGYTGPKVKGPVNTITIGFEGVAGMEALEEGEYSLFHEGLGTIEGVNVSPTICKEGGDTPHYDVTFQV